MTDASERALLEILEYLRSALDDPRCKDEAWLELEPTPHLRAELQPGELGEPPAALPCYPPRLALLLQHELIGQRSGNRPRLYLTLEGRETLERSG